MRPIFSNLCYWQAQLALRQMAKEKSAECDDPDKLFGEDDGENEPGSRKGCKGGKKGRGRGRGKGKGRSGASSKADTESEPKPEEVCVDTRMDEGLDETEPEVGEKPPKCPKIEKAPENAPEKIRKKRAPAKPLPANRESQPKKAKTGEEDQKNEDQKAHSCIFYDMNVLVGST